MLAINIATSSFWCQSLIPACAGTPRYENPELPFHAANSHSGFCHAPPPAPAGDKPPRYISHPRPSGLRLAPA